MHTTQKNARRIFAALENPENPDAAKIAGEEFYKNFYGAAGNTLKISSIPPKTRNLQKEPRSSDSGEVAWAIQA